MTHVHSHNLPDRTPAFNLMQTVKRRLFAMRNGLLADQMRNAGLDYRINFGLNIMQVKEIAAELNQSELPENDKLELAKALWDNINTRESRLLAPLIYPFDNMTRELASKWLHEAQTTEVADHLCHAMLRKLPYAKDIAIEVFSDSKSTDLNRYSALRLILNLLIIGKIDPEIAKNTAETEKDHNCKLTLSLTKQILEEVEFMLE